MKKFNVNEHIYIQITEEGWKYLKKRRGISYVTSVRAMYGVNIDGEDWYRIQCWEAFELFPSGLGIPPYFKRDIMFEDSDLIGYDKDKKQNQNNDLNVDMKNKIVEILNSQTFGMTDEDGFRDRVVSGDEFDFIANKVVELFAREQQPNA